MHISERTAGDRRRLAGLIRRERDAEQRDRYRAALLAIEQQSTRTIMTMTARSRGFVQRWAYAYRDGGIEAIAARPCGGSQPKLDAARQAEFIARFKAGPTEADESRTRVMRDSYQMSLLNNPLSLPGRGLG